MDQTTLESIIAGGETLLVEFKFEEAGKPILDREIFENIVALANTERGWLLIGVRDNGTVLGAQSRHPHGTPTDKLEAAIRNNVSASVQVRVSAVPTERGDVSRKKTGIARAEHDHPSYKYASIRHGEPKPSPSGFAFLAIHESRVLLPIDDLMHGCSEIGYNWVLSECWFLSRGTGLDVRLNII